MAEVDFGTAAVAVLGSEGRAIAAKSPTILWLQ